MSKDSEHWTRKKNLKDFDLRLQKARNLSTGSTNIGNAGLPEDGKSQAMRIGTELVVAVAVGGGIGFLLDNWLETKPWFLLGFLLLGNVAGLWNIFRIANGHKYKVGFKDDEKV
jgi:ATP synthase protein I